MRGLPASPAFARQQRARQHQPVVLGEALAGAGFDDREPLPEVIEGVVSGPLLRPQAAQAEIKTRKMGFGAAAGAQMEAGQERREPGLALDWLVGLPGAGQQKRAEERRQTVGLCHPGVSTKNGVDGFLGGNRFEAGIHLVDLDPEFIFLIVVSAEPFVEAFGALELAYLFGFDDNRCHYVNRRLVWTPVGVASC